jgi:hypothetical protein
MIYLYRVAGATGMLNRKWACSSLRLGWRVHKCYNNSSRKLQSWAVTERP